MSKSITKIEGFKELNEKIKLLSDKVKRREMIKILRIAAKPIVKAARIQAPVRTSNLKKSIGVRIDKKDKTNAILYVGPRTTGTKYNGYYGAMVHYGTVNQSPNPFMDRAYNQTKALISQEAENKTIELLQKKINQLSNK